MGWSSGAKLADDIWWTVSGHIYPDKRGDIARQIVELFESEDCDTMEETYVWQVAYPDEKENE